MMKWGVDRKLVGGGVILLTAIVLVATQIDPRAPATQSTSAVLRPTVSVNGEMIRVTVVDTPATRERGLSGHAPLDPDEGMLFVFQRDGKYGFWMKDMLFSIDIMWIAADGKIVHIAKSVSPSTYPQNFEPSELARFVLELPAGYTERHKITVGDIVRL